MAITYSSGHFWNRSGFWTLRHRVALIGLGLIIFPAALLLYDQAVPAMVKAGPLKALSIEHQTWGRTGVTQDIDVRVERSKGRPVKLYLDAAFGKNFAIERSLPLPKTITAEDGGGQVMLFDGPADADFSVTLTLRPLSWGRSEVQLRSDVPGIMMASSTLRELILP
jgi:hypothetical protein